MKPISSSSIHVLQVISYILLNCSQSLAMQCLKCPRLFRCLVSVAQREVPSLSSEKGKCHTGGSACKSFLLSWVAYLQYFLSNFFSHFNSEHIWTLNIYYAFKLFTLPKAQKSEDRWSQNDSGGSSAFDVLKPSSFLTKQVAIEPVELVQCVDNRDTMLGASVKRPLEELTPENSAVRHLKRPRLAQFLSPWSSMLQDFGIPSCFASLLNNKFQLPKSPAASFLNLNQSQGCMFLAENGSKRA